ncbi:alpha-hydroxy-acid oxidizing protein [Georgenia sp. 10Sc9-8]|uniref:Alpha-hydroxy-acid oxidizing protein n=1 Tax=Georgenia halotolerans TaxID=3028317 RepID=A0ABT5U1V1_9MICO|nr:alpha-hydroxy-acid oxidizing protein [Georgenia halotolerans]
MTAQPTRSTETAPAATSGDSDTQPARNVGRWVQSRVYLNGAMGRRPTVPVAPARLEAAARRAMSRRGFAYVAGAAGAESTARANRAALDRVRIVPRRLVDVSSRSTATTVLGTPMSAPVYLAPIGVLEMAHREADVAAVGAAADTGVPMMVSTQASRPMEEVAAAAPGHPLWFQLYWSSNEDLVTSFVGRAERAGYGAVVVTLDTQMLGWRPRDLDLGFLPFARGLGMAQYTSDPVFRDLVRRRAAGGVPGPTVRPGPGAIGTLLSMARAYPGSTVENLRSPLPRAAVQSFLDVFAQPALTWSDLARLREVTTLPVLLKGVMHPDDALRARDAGVDGIVVSNHGGRQIDGELGALDALPDVVQAVPELPVLVEGGVRGGADVLKALALGARAVGLGRPYAYGLAVAGRAGAREAVRHVLAELDLTMALTGCPSVADVEPELVRRR